MKEIDKIRIKQWNQDNPYRLKGRDFVHQGKIEIEVNERAVFIRTQGCFFVYTNSDCFLNSLSSWKI